MQHLDEGTIHAWLDGELPVDDAARVAGHVAECEECAALAAEARGVMAGASRIVSSLDAVPAGVIPRAPSVPLRRRPWYSFALTPSRMSIAATILVAAGVTLTLQRTHAGVDRPPTARKIDSPPMAKIDSSAPLSVRVADSASTVPTPAGAPAPPAMPGPKPQNTPGAGLKQVASTYAQAQPPADSSALAAKASTEKKAPAGEPAASDARLDSARAKDELQQVVVDSLSRQTLERRKAAVATSQLQPLPVSNASERDASAPAPALVDCYHLEIDSTDWRRVLPSSFALSLASTGTGREGAGGAGGAGGQATAGMVGGGARPVPVATRALARAALFSPTGNIVHAVLANGRVDSTAIGDWRAIGQSVVSVHFAATDQQKPVSVLLTTTSSTARLISNDRTDSVKVVRTTCRP